GLYSELVESGYCIFDVSKEGGAVEEPPQYADHQIVDRFGDGRFSLRLSNGLDPGASRMYAEMEGDILRVYYEFYNPELEDKELSLHSQIYLYYSGDEEGSEAGRYAFTLENYAGDRVYEVDKYTKVYLSYLSVYISSTKQISVNMEAVMENGKRKKVFKSGDSNSGEGVTEDGGKVLSARYDKTFSKLFPVDQVKELYLNGKKLKEIKE
ncbi:MAG: hypothetical protein IJ733_19110, partial [Lachnospiraceae bacterium]|nr:hypothetical protein [Lachnospiraceae bacterium]